MVADLKKIYVHDNPKVIKIEPAIFHKNGPY